MLVSFGPQQHRAKGSGVVFGRPKKRALYLLKLRAPLVLQLGGRLPAACQLPEGYRLEIVSPEDTCPDCGRGLRRNRTSTHQPVGLRLGRPRVRRVQKGCPGCGWTEPRDGYGQLVPPGGNDAFDLIAEVGLARFRDLKPDAKILEQWEQRWGLTLPRSAVGLLSDSFLDGLASVHQARLGASKSPSRRSRLRFQGHGDLRSRSVPFRGSIVRFQPFKKA